MLKAISSEPINVYNKQEVIEVLKDNLKSFRKFGVKEIGLFGSFVRNEASLESDIDLLVKIVDFNFENFCELQDFAQSLFKDRSVDIVLESNINEINGIYICREVEYVYQN